jgi:hypothetical protein
MRRAVATLAFAALLASGAASFTLLPNAAEVEARPAQDTFLVAADDGYGFGDCLTTGGNCGQVVADAWCETHGFSRAVSFSRAKPGEVTASVQRVTLGSREPPVAITCSK